MGECNLAILHAQSLPQRTLTVSTDMNGLNEGNRQYVEEFCACADQVEKIEGFQRD